MYKPVKGAEPHRGQTAKIDMEEKSIEQRPFDGCSSSTSFCQFPETLAPANVSRSSKPRLIRGICH